MAETRRSLLSAVVAGALLLIFLPATAAAAAAATGSHAVVHERRGDHHAHTGLWKRHSRAPAHHVLPMKVGLKQRNLENTHLFVMDVADPASPNFGKHWSAERVAKTFASAEETSAKTIAWLVGGGIGRDRLRSSAGRNWLEFNATVGEIEDLLATEYHFFEHADGGFRIACDEYSVPHHVREHIDFLMPTVQLDGLRPAAYKRPGSRMRVDQPIRGLNGTDVCPQMITIDCMRALYNFTAGTTKHAGNVLGIGEWADYLYLPDLNAFFKNFTSPEIPPDTKPEFISIDGGRALNQTTAEDELIESALDFQTAYSIVWPQDIRLYQVGDGVNMDSVGTFSIFLDALDASYCTYMGGDAPYIDPKYPDWNMGGWTGKKQCGGAPLSSVMSLSYGQIEAALPRFYQERQCHEWAKLALQGVSVLFASGDDGVANRYNVGYPETCVDKDYGFISANGTKFSPSFPVNCPYITAVGATQLNGSVAGGEVAVYWSGGGFSDIFPMPEWQASAVGGYLDKHAPHFPPDVVWNNSGHARAYPDVSALGVNLTTVYLGTASGVDGTSASTPLFASIITLLNEERMQAGKGPIGFLNPTLYANPDMFNDIVSGSNPGCHSDGFSCAPAGIQ